MALLQDLGFIDRNLGSLLVEADPVEWVGTADEIRARLLNIGVLPDALVPDAERKWLQAKPIAEGAVAEEPG